MHKIEADWMTLMRQASSTASTYLTAAMMDVGDYHELDQLPKPELMALALKQAEIAAHDFRSSCISVAADKIADALADVAEALRQSR